MNPGIIQLCNARKLEIMQDNSKNNFLSQKQEISLAALLSGKSKRQAAKAASVNEATLYRWLSDDELFSTELKKRQSKIFDQTSARLFSLAEKAISTLERNLKCGNPNAEIKCALGILSQTVRIQENLLFLRIQKLEKIFSKEMENYYEINELDSEN